MKKRIIKNYGWMADNAVPFKEVLNPEEYPEYYV
jgi:hypothetical protein